MEAFLEFALTQPHLFDGAFSCVPRERGSAPRMMFVRIDQAKADGRPSPPLRREVERSHIFDRGALPT